MYMNCTLYIYISQMHPNDSWFSPHLPTPPRAPRVEVWTWRPPPYRRNFPDGDATRSGKKTPVKLLSSSDPHPETGFCHSF